MSYPKFKFKMNKSVGRYKHFELPSANILYESNF
jgi:hypothetical protein